jgi:hypothetical protein
MSLTGLPGPSTNPGGPDAQKLTSQFVLTDFDDRNTGFVGFGSEVPALADTVFSADGVQAANENKMHKSKIDSREIAARMFIGVLFFLLYRQPYTY